VLVRTNGKIISKSKTIWKNGYVALEGKSEELKNNDEIRRLYLGG
jgi:branched-chain amino acid transport system ATP-binding protein